MGLFVIDASVAAKWFLPAAGETLVDEAFSLLARYAEAVEHSGLQDRTRSVYIEVGIAPVARSLIQRRRTRQVLDRYS